MCECGGGLLIKYRRLIPRRQKKKKILAVQGTLNQKNLTNPTNLARGYGSLIVISKIIKYSHYSVRDLYDQKSLQGLQGLQPRRQGPPLCAACARCENAGRRQALRAPVAEPPLLHALLFILTRDCPDVLHMAIHVTRQDSLWNGAS